MTGAPLDPADPEPEQPHKFAADRFKNAGLSLSGLWAYYYGIGGTADEFDLDGYLNGLTTLDQTQMALVVTALEELDDEGRGGPASGRRGST